jgi:hypothetical protein
VESAVLSSLASRSGQRTYDYAIREFVAWYCSEPRLAFNRTVVLRYRIHLEQRQYAPATINLRLARVWQTPTLVTMSEFAVIETPAPGIAPEQRTTPRQPVRRPPIRNVHTPQC